MPVPDPSLPPIRFPSNKFELSPRGPRKRCEMPTLRTTASLLAVLSKLTQRFVGPAVVSLPTTSGPGWWVFFPFRNFFLLKTINFNCPRYYLIPGSMAIAFFQYKFAELDTTRHDLILNWAGGDVSPPWNLESLLWLASWGLPWFSKVSQSYSMMAEKND